VSKRAIGKPICINAQLLKQAAHRSFAKPARGERNSRTLILSRAMVRQFEVNRAVAKQDVRQFMAEHCKQLGAADTLKQHSCDSDPVRAPTVFHPGAHVRHRYSQSTTGARNPVNLRTVFAAVSARESLITFDAALALPGTWQGLSDAAWAPGMVQSRRTEPRRSNEAQYSIAQMLM
jgi:hypothetical protein